jgi:hypothetical protein
MNQMMKDGIGYLTPGLAVPGIADQYGPFSDD